MRATRPWTAGAAGRRAAGGQAPEPDPGEVRVANEFARARVSLDRRGHHLRLRVEDQRSGATVLLDALDLVSLARADRSDLDALVFGDEYRATIDDPQADGGGDHGG